MKPDIKAINMVRPIFTIHCLSHIFQKLLWYLKPKNICILLSDITYVYYLQNK